MWEATETCSTHPGTSRGAPTSTPKRSVDWGPYGRKPITILAFVAFIDAVDRQTLAGVIPLVQDDLGFSDSQIGILGSIFVVMSFVAMIPAGYMADRFRRTRVIASVLAVWSGVSALNAAVMNYWQFLSIRAALGVGEVLGSPASNSLIADYYPARLRGRAYSYQRAAPIFGLAAGLGLSGAVGAWLGWRAAFLLVGPPGAVFAWWVWRMKEPVRGESDGSPAAPEEAGLLHAATRRGFSSLKPEIAAAARIPSLQRLMVGSAISTGATAGFGFWAAAFYERHTALGVGAAGGVVGGVILIGGLVGIIFGGRAVDRVRGKSPAAPMVLIGTCQSIASVIFLITFFPVPLWVRLPGQMLGVAFLLAALPALSAMISQVVPARIRGISFSLNGFLTALVSAGSPLAIGWLADRFPVIINGVERGNLAVAFGIVTPLIFLGAMVVLNGRRHVATDIAAVPDLDARLRDSLPDEESFTPGTTETLGPEAPREREGT